MGTFQRKYATEEVEAVTRAIVVDGKTARAAIELAAAGELGLPAFTMPLGTAQKYSQRMREKLERGYSEAQRKRTLTEVGPEYLRLVLDAAGMEARRQHKIAADGKTNLQKLGQVADVIARVANAEAKINGKATGPSMSATDAGTPEGDAWAKRLADLERTA